jgi:hypothetical protein
MPLLLLLLLDPTVCGADTPAACTLAAYTLDAELSNVGGSL